MVSNDETNPEAAADASAGHPHRTNLTEQESLRKDMSYSPASETEIAAKQADPLPDSLDDDIDPARVRAVPGTGGPDDTGDVDVDPGEIDIPRSPNSATP